MNVFVLLVLVAFVALLFGYFGAWLRGKFRDRAELFPEATDEQLLALRRERARYARECAGDYPMLATGARRAVRRYDRALRRRGITIDVSTGETVADLTDPAKVWDREFSRLTMTREARS